MADLMAILFIVVTVSNGVDAAENWPQFRGPGGHATSDDTGLPTTWSDEENVVWKSPLPGFGTSSPIVWGERIFLTCYSGYGLDIQNPGEESNLRRHLLCFNRADGKIVWDREVPARLPAPNYIDFLTLHGYATSTPACDGERVYVFFGTSGVFAYDLDGKQLWQADVGHQAHYWGSAASPVVNGDLVFINATVESQTVFALDKRTGKEVWKSSGLLSSWSTPLATKTAEGQTELVVSVRSRLVGFNPETGEKLWTCPTKQSYAASSPLAQQGLVYMASGRPSSLLAIRTGGRGDVGETHVERKIEGIGSSITTPVLYGNHIYSVDERGIAACVEAATGKILYKERLGAEGVTLYASVVAADEKLYVVSREQGVFVLAAGPEFRQLAVNRFASDTSVFNATPTVHRGQLLLRSNRFIYCLGQTGK
jgi:outer membrane protein assembly factor BamB